MTSIISSARMDACIAKRSFAAAAVGVPGAFAAHADIPVLIGIWGEMIYKVANLSDNPLDKKQAAKLAAAVGAALGTMGAGMKAVSTGMSYTGIGTVPGILLNSGANGIATYYVGQTTKKLVLKDELSLEDFVPAVLAALGVGMTDGGGGSNYTPS